MLEERKGMAFKKPPEDSEFKVIKVNNHETIEKSIECGPPVEYLKTLSRHQMREHWLIAMEWMKLDHLACFTFVFTKGHAGVYHGMPLRAPPYGSYNNDPFDRVKVGRLPIRHIEFGLHNNAGEEKLTDVLLTNHK